MQANREATICYIRAIYTHNNLLVDVNDMSVSNDDIIEDSIAFVYDIMRGLLYSHGVLPVECMNLQKVVTQTESEGIKPRAAWALFWGTVIAYRNSKYLARHERFRLVGCLSRFFDETWNVYQNLISDYVDDPTNIVEVEKAIPAIPRAEGLSDSDFRRRLYKCRPDHLPVMYTTDFCNNSLRVATVMYPIFLNIVRKAETIPEIKRIIVYGTSITDAYSSDSDIDLYVILQDNVSNAEDIRAELMSVSNKLDILFDTTMSYNLALDMGIIAAVRRKGRIIYRKRVRDE